MNMKDLLELAQWKPIVTFQKGILDIPDEYPEPGMRAKIIGATHREDDELIEVQFDFGIFDDHNKQFETANYYDQKTRSHCLTARESGSYKPIGSILFDATASCDAFFEVGYTEGLKLFHEYQSSDDASKGIPYAVWLENQVLQLRNELGYDDKASRVQHLAWPS